MTTLEKNIIERSVTSDFLKYASQVYHNLSPATLIEHAIQRGEGQLAANGAFNASTGKHTGRSPKDKYVVRDGEVDELIAWGAVNQPMEPEVFDRLMARALAYVQNRPLYVQDCFVGADPRHRLSVRVVTEFAWHNLFAQQLFVRPTPEERVDFQPQVVVLDVPGLRMDPECDGTRSETVIAMDLSAGYVLIAGTAYAGEIKKSIFSIMNFWLPQKGIFPMHCAANQGESGDVALFFGLSGTGKTSLSADPSRLLIGDDEHGWSNDGVFNFEGGCYAKCIRLSEKNEPDIWNAIRFGSVLENVVIAQDTRIPDYDDASITENTRAAYPLTYIQNALEPSVGGHPLNIFFLTCDAFGVLPPISKLTTEQAMEQFLLGYTAKVAGTEVGVTEPEMTFSTCFGSPFLPLPPREYARLLGDKLNQHPAQVWLVNTGWTGGAYGTGARISIQYTRALIHAALDGSLKHVETQVDPFFGLHVPVSCPGVPSEILQSRQTWQDPAAYDAQARRLAEEWAKRIGAH